MPTLWSRFKSMFGRREPAPGQDDPMTNVRWVPAADNPFGVELLDCRASAGGMLAMTGNQQVAASFATLRSSDGRQHRGRWPEAPVSRPCDLTYPAPEEPADGPLFKAEVMEDKWDIYLYDQTLYFVRSWTDQLEYRARVEFGKGVASVTEVTSRPPMAERDGPYPVQIVDYLIRSHILGMPIPHPLPESIDRNLETLTLFSFSMYGRRGLYGTFADTRRLRLPEA